MPVQYEIVNPQLFDANRLDDRNYHSEQINNLTSGNISPDEYSYFIHKLVKPYIIEIAKRIKALGGDSIYTVGDGEEHEKSHIYYFGKQAEIELAEESFVTSSYSSLCRLKMWEDDLRNGFIAPGYVFPRGGHYQSLMEAFNDQIDVAN
jgi:hypothetical protein